MSQENLNRIKTIANGLGELNERVVYVGGAVAQLYVSDPAATDIRPTLDVDCVVDLSSYNDYNKFCELLQRKHFYHDTTSGAPICRWTFEGEIVDIMSDDENAIGFTNRWYKPGLRNKIVYKITNSLSINLMSVEYYVASKMEAVLSRGGTDYRGSHDFEDIVYILNYYPDFYSVVINNKDKDLTRYLQNVFSSFLKRPNINEEIQCALPYGEQDRCTTILDTIKAIVTHYESMNGYRTYTFNEAKNVVVCGDIHGDFLAVVYKLCIQYQMTDTLLIIAGDCGFGFEKPGYYDIIYKKASSKLSKSNNWVVMIRGNHDDPTYFNEQKIAHKRFMTIPDYSVISTCGHNILCIGGAISIDRSYRIKMMNQKQGTKLYWPNEAPFYNENALNAICKSLKIDTVITHTAPSFCELITKNGLISWAREDEHLLEDCTNERMTMDMVLKHLTEHEQPVTRWFYGHFHQSWNSKIDDITYSMLDIAEFRTIP